MTARSAQRDDEKGRRDAQSGADRHVADTESDGHGGSSAMRFARLLMRRKPFLILLILSVCLILTVLYSWELVRNGEVSGLILVGANLCAFVIALVYLADDLLRR